MRTVLLSSKPVPEMETSNEAFLTVAVFHMHKAQANFSIVPSKDVLEKLAWEQL